MEYLLFAMVGAVSGLVFYFLAIHHVTVRSSYDNREKLALIKKKYFIPVWMLSYMLLFLIVALVDLDLERDITDPLVIWSTVKILLFACLAFNVGAVDILLRRIPNAILLGMMCIHICDIVVCQLGQGNATDLFMHSFAGLFLGYAMFKIPATFKLSVGAGDVKFSAVIGFMLGIKQYIYAMLIMAAVLLLFYVYLRITKTGNMKTKAPMGPFLAVGTFVAMLIPLATL